MFFTVLVLYTRQAIKVTYKRCNVRNAILLSLNLQASDDEKMSQAKPVRCQKCGKPIGYVTVLAKGFRFQQPVQNVKVVAICMECHQKKQ
jgi:hypothetical protein